MPASKKGTDRSDRQPTIPLLERSRPCRNDGIICRNSCNVEKRRVIHNVHRIIHILRWILPVLPSLSVDNHAKCCRYKDFGSIPRIMRLGHSCKETGLLLQAIPASKLADVLFLCVGRGILFQISARSDPRSGLLWIALLYGQGHLSVKTCLSIVFSCGLLIPPDGSDPPSTACPQRGQ